MGKMGGGFNFRSEDTKLYSVSNPSTDHTHHRSVGEVAALHGGVQFVPHPRRCFKGVK